MNILKKSLTKLSKYSLINTYTKTKFSSSNSCNAIYIWGQDKIKDIQEFKKVSYQVIDDLVEHMKNTNNRTVLPKCKPNFLRPLLNQEKLSSKPTDVKSIQKEINEDILKNFTLFGHNGYLSWFPCMTSYPGILGHLINHSFENPSRSWETNSVIFELERKVANWFLHAYNLPSNFRQKNSGAVIYHGVSLSSISTTLAAKRKKLTEIQNKNTLNNINNDSSSNNILVNKFKYYCSEQAHYSVRKATNIAGGQSVLIPVRFCKKSNNYIMNIDILKEKVEQDVKNGFIPTYICSTIGTTGTTAIDETSKINEVAVKYGMWHHVDAAYSGNSAILPEYSWVLDGVDKVNSFAFNPVKMFPIMQNSAMCYYTNINEAVRAYESTNELSIENGKWNLNYLEFGTARLNKVLKIYTVISNTGINYFRELARRIYSGARVIEAMLENDTRFELMFNPCKFGLVCFKLRNKSNEDLIKFMNKVNEDGRIFIGPYNVDIDGKELILLRISVNYLYTTDEIIKQNMRDIINCYDKVFKN